MWILYVFSVITLTTFCAPIPILPKEISFVKFESPLLYLRCDSTIKQVRLEQEGRNCIFKGTFIEDEKSKIVLTGCMDIIELQIESDVFGDLIFASAGVEFRLVQDKTIDYKMNSSKRVERSSVKHREYLDKRFAPPDQVSLHVNVYLDPFWTKRLEGVSIKVAKEVIAHTKHLLKQKSLQTKIDLSIENIFESGGSHLDVTLYDLEENMKAKIRRPWTVKGSPVASVYLTDSVTTDLNENSRRGWAMQGSICNQDQTLARCIVKYVKSPLNTAIVVAHEVLHMFGAKHDHESGNEACMENRFIMNSNKITNRIEWSHCTNKDFQEFFKSILSKTGKFCLEENDCVDAVNIERNTWYLGKGGTQLLGSATKFLDCGTECYLDKDCKFWTFHEPTYECTLNSGGFRKLSDKDSTSGLPICPNTELGTELDMVVVGGRDSTSTFFYHEGKICLANVESHLPSNMTRMEAQATWYDDKIVYCGGTGLDSWTNNCVALSQNTANQNLVGGGWNDHSQMVYIRRWFSLTAMPEDIVDYYDYDEDVNQEVVDQEPVGGLIAVGGVGKKFGGEGFSDSLFSTEYYNGSAWSEVTKWNMPSTRYSHCAVVFKGSLVLIGGTIDGSLTSSVIRLDTQQNKWEYMPEMDIGIEEHACTVVMVGKLQKIFVSGGRDDNFFSSGLSSVVYMFEEYRGWDKVGTLVRPRRNHVMGTSGQQLVVAFGYGENGEGRKNMEVSNFDGEEWGLVFAQDWMHIQDKRWPGVAMVPKNTFSYDLKCDLHN